MEKLVKDHLRQKGWELLEMDNCDLPEDMEERLFSVLEELQDIFKSFGGYGEEEMLKVINYYLLEGLFYWWDSSVLEEKGITISIKGE